MTESSCQLLSDRLAILDCINRYARGMDRLDRDLVLSAYHSDAIDDHVAFVGPVEKFVDWAFEYHGGQLRHQHYVLNHCAEIDRDTAHTETYYVFIATECDPNSPLLMVGGRYIDRFERRNGKWAIAARVCLAEWQTNVPSGFSAAAMEFMSAAGTVARNPSDTSYARPLIVDREMA